MNRYYVYIVRCSDNTLYTGYTNNLKKRLNSHNNGSGAKYTRGRGPVTLEYRETFSDKSRAMRREYEIKTYTKKKKENLIREKGVKYGGLESKG